MLTGTTGTITLPSCIAYFTCIKNYKSFLTNIHYLSFLLVNNTTHDTNPKKILRLFFAPPTTSNHQLHTGNVKSVQFRCGRRRLYALQQVLRFEQRVLVNKETGYCDIIMCTFTYGLLGSAREASKHKTAKQSQRNISKNLSVASTTKTQSCAVCRVSCVLHSVLLSDI